MVQRTRLLGVPTPESVQLAKSLASTSRRRAAATNLRANTRAGTATASAVSSMSGKVQTKRYRPAGLHPSSDIITPGAASAVSLHADMLLMPDASIIRLASLVSPPSGLPVASSPVALPRAITRTRRHVPIPLLSPELQTLVLAHLAGEPLKSLSTDAFRRALPLALTCRAYYSAFKSAVRGVRLLPIGFASAVQHHRIRPQDRASQPIAPSPVLSHREARAVVVREPSAEHARKDSAFGPFGRRPRPPRKISDSNVQAMVSALPALVEIQLSTTVALTDAGVLAIARFCPQVRVLKISGIHQITDMAVRSLRTCKHMHTLDLSFCSKFSDAAAVDLAAMPALVSLSVSRWSITDMFVKNLFANGGGAAIASLSLSGCSELSDLALVHACSGAGSRLRSLKLRHCRRITDAGLDALVSNCVVLESLDISSNDMVTADGVARLGNISTLRSIDANSVANISDAAVAQLVESGLLTSISLSWCPQLSDGTAQCLSACPGLVHVNLSGCKRLTDLGVTALAALPVLEKIGLMYCGELTSASLRTLATAANAPLKEVDVRFVRNLDGDMLEHLRANCDVVHDSIAPIAEGQGQRIWTCRREIRNVPIASPEYF